MRSEQDNLSQIETIAAGDDLHAPAAPHIPISSQQEVIGMCEAATAAPAHAPLFSVVALPSTRAPSTLWNDPLDCHPESPPILDENQSTKFKTQLLSGIQEANRYSALIAGIVNWRETWWKRCRSHLQAQTMFAAFLISVYVRFESLQGTQRYALILTMLISTMASVILLKIDSVRLRLTAFQACEGNSSALFRACDLDYFIPGVTDRNQAIRCVSSSLVQRILTNIQSSDAESLSLDSRDFFIDVLKSRDVTLPLAVLSALEKIGDERELSLTERIAQGHGAGRHEEVAQRAREVLPALRIRVSQLQAQRTLLRPYEAVADSDRLVRPAGRTDAQENALLRSSEPAESRENALLRPSEPEC